MNRSIYQIFQDEILPRGTRLVGLSYIVKFLNIKAWIREPKLASEKLIKENRSREGAWEIFSRRYWPGDSIFRHLVFSLKYENLDMVVLKHIFKAVDKNKLTSFIASTPTGVHTRKIWFLFELLMDETLEIKDAPTVKAINLLDERKYFTSKGELSSRHKVINNLLGTKRFCPVVKKTKLLQKLINQNLKDKANSLIKGASKRLISRAASFLLLSDTKASFEIEGERVPINRIERWARTVMQAGKYPLSLLEIERLHRLLIRDERFTKIGLRKEGVFLGDRDHYDTPIPEFIGARENDLLFLIDALIEADTNLKNADIDPIIHAAAIAFAFIYIHPLEDGNGRLHRYLIHHVLAERNFTPKGIIFPVSATIYDHIEKYKDVLQSHSSPLMNLIEWKATEKGNVSVTNETLDLYRYFDCTEACEFLYSCVKETIEITLPKEFQYLKNLDMAMERVMNLVEMPDNMAQKLISYVLDNNGKLSKNKKKKDFSVLTDEEVRRLEDIINDSFSD